METCCAPGRRRSLFRGGGGLEATAEAKRRRETDIRARERDRGRRASWTPTAATSSKRSRWREAGISPPLSRAASFLPGHKSSRFKERCRGKKLEEGGAKYSCGGAVFEKVKPAVVLLFVLGNVEHIVRQRRRRRLLLRSRLDASRAQKKVQSLHYYIDDKAVIQSPGPTFVASLSPPKSPPSIHHALSCPLFFSLPSPLARPDQFGGGKTHTREGEALQLAHLVVVAVATWANRSPY